MADPYATIATAPESVQTRIADAMAARSAEDAQVAMRRDYLARAVTKAGTVAVDFGCGTGHLTRDLAEVFGCARAIGIDPSPVMVARARLFHAGVPGIEFAEGDARNSGLPSGFADLAVFHTVLCHVPGPERALAEAFRVLRPGGTLAVFDGDYVTTTVARTPDDPLQPVAESFMAGHVHDIWLTRRLPELLQASGFRDPQTRPHAYVAEGAAPYFRSVILRGADDLVARGALAPERGAALKEMADERLRSGTFFGFILYLSTLARKPEAA